MRLVDLPRGDAAKRCANDPRFLLVLHEVDAPQAAAAHAAEALRQLVEIVVHRFDGHESVV
jgi:hypothetical protein